MASHKSDFPNSHDPEYNQPNEQNIHKRDPQQLAVIAPTDPPGFNQPAARALLRILLAAHQRLRHPTSEEA